MAVNGTGNSFPTTECTFWADERYHQLTGYFVPWDGNAYQWSGQASKYQWNESNSPTVPSIVVLQPGIQGSDPINGHVGVVEKVNADGTFVASSLNWGTNPVERSTIQQVTFKTGNGVSFLTATNPTNTNDIPLTLGHFVNEALINLAQNFLYTPSLNITNFMISWAHNEGGGVTNSCKFNILNTMQQEQGSVQCANTLPGIQSYPDAQTGIKAFVDAMSNGSYQSLKNALTTNDEINLGMSKRDSPVNAYRMAGNVAGDLCVWRTGKRDLTNDNQQYIIRILQGAGISNAEIEGGTIEGGPANKIDASWGLTPLGGNASDVQPFGTPDTLGGLEGLNNFFSGLGNFFSNPNRAVKIGLGSVLVIVASVLVVKELR